MTTVLLLQTTRGRDGADDAALSVAARELAPCQVLAATADPERTARATGLSVMPAQRSVLLRALSAVDALVVLGGRPFGRAPAAEVLPLAALCALVAAYRIAGRRVALVGVGVDAVTGHRARLTRHLVLGSALAVLDSPASAAHLAAAGVPSPIRVGADLAWLDLQDPPARRPAGTGPLRVVLGRAEVDGAGGPGAVAGLLSTTLAALRERHGDLPALALHARCPGPGAGADLDAAAEVARALGAQATAEAGLRVETVAPATTLQGLRDALTWSSLALVAHDHEVMAGAAAGVPLLGWAQDGPGGAAAAPLALPSLPSPASLRRGQVALLLEEASARAGTAQAAVRQQVATAGEVVDLLRLLLTEGETPVGPSRTSGADQVRSPRPTGVMR